MEKGRCVSVTTSIILLLVLALPPNSDSVELRSMGRAITHSLGNLYSFRNKIPLPEQSTESQITTVPLPPLSPTGLDQGHNPSVAHPSNIQSTMQFRNRMARIDHEPPPLSGTVRKSTGSVKWKKARRISKNQNIQNYKSQATQEPAPSETTIMNTNLSFSSVSPLSMPPLPTSSPTLQSQVYSIGRGISNVMTEILTRKFMKILDRDVPPGVFMPMKHLVASGNEMVEYWDQRKTNRDGKSLGVVDLLGHGLEHLKRLRDGHAIKASDPVANLTSPAETMIQGLVTMKRLTNRMLGYDVNDGFVARGYDSYGHGGYGHMGYGHGHGHGGLYGGLDPFSILAALGFAAFLLQLLLTLLINNARSMNEVTLNNPFTMRDSYLPNFMNSRTSFLGTPTVRTKRSVGYEAAGEEMFDAILDRVDGVYQTYTQISHSPRCARIYMCRLTKEDFQNGDKSVLTPLYMYGLERLGKENNPADFLRNIKNRLINGESVDCAKEVPECNAK